MGGELLAFNEKIFPLLKNKELVHIKINKYTLSRYLCAFRCLDLAYERLLETNEWRREFGVEKLTGDLPSIKAIHRMKKACILEKHDRMERPVIYIAVRNHSIYNRDLEELTHYIVFILEEACKQCNEEIADNLCIIFDLEDFSISCMDYSFIKDLIWIVSRHYPERLGVCYIVNAPLLFTACWAIIQKWLDERTRNKVKFVSTLQALDPYLDASLIPTDF